MRTRNVLRRAAAALVAAAACVGSWPCAAWAQDAGQPTINWGGLQWNVKSRLGQKPGPNNWSAANVTVDASGDLHLSITVENHGVTQGRLAGPVNDLAGACVG